MCYCECSCDCELKRLREELSIIDTEKEVLELTEKYRTGACYKFHICFLALVLAALISSFAPEIALILLSIAGIVMLCFIHSQSEFRYWSLIRRLYHPEKKKGKK